MVRMKKKQTTVKIHVQCLYIYILPTNVINRRGSVQTTDGTMTELMNLHILHYATQTKPMATTSLRMNT